MAKIDIHKFRSTPQQTEHMKYIYQKMGYVRKSDFLRDRSLTDPELERQVKENNSLLKQLMEELSWMKQKLLSGSLS